MSKTIAALGASVLLCASQLAHAGLPGSISGPWYNPEQSGHGLTVDVVSPDKAVVIWHVFDPDGHPLTLYIEGDISGRRIDGEAYAPEGMRFGEFDRSDVQLPHWGSVDIEFDDCNNARLDWSAEESSYGDGNMSIIRLAGLNGVDCNLPPSNDIASGMYHADAPDGTRFHGVVDNEGVLWATDDRPLPSSIWAWNSFPYAVVVRPLRPEADTTPATLLAFTGFWARHPKVLFGSRTLRNAEWRENDNGHYLTWPYPDPVVAGVTDPIVFEPGDSDQTMIAPLAIADIAGGYSIPQATQFLGMIDVHATVDERGNVCIGNVVGVDDCTFRGKLSFPDGIDGIIDFQIHSTENPDLPPYRGRGWLAQSGEGSKSVLRLNMVGSNDYNGFVFRGLRQADD